MIRINYDALGIAASVACAIHCAVLPLVLSSLPLFGVNIINNVNFELIMIALAFGIGFYSLWHGYKKHHHKVYPMILFGAGISLLMLKQYFHSYLLSFLIPAVLLIVAGHWTNYRACKKASHCHREDCNH
jgi:4-amino-4-deoxy-L-arabinose transferase-like glycosyltransferase